MAFAERISDSSLAQSLFQNKTRNILERVRSIQLKRGRALAMPANNPLAIVGPTVNGGFGVLENRAPTASLMADRGGDCQRSAEEFAGAVRAALLGIPCQFECLVFIAGLQGPVALNPFCDSLGLDCDSDSVDLIISSKHREIFYEWLSLSDEDRLADFEAYASIPGVPLAQVGRQWLVPGRRDCLIPCGVMAPEKRLFEVHSEVLLKLISKY